MEECATSYVIKETQIKTIPSTPTGMAQTRNPADPKGREGVERRLARTLGMQNGTATLQDSRAASCRKKQTLII